MKKIAFLIVILLTGCSIDLNNTPTKRVEKFLNDYQTLNKSVLTELSSEVNNDASLTEDERDTYLEFWKKHYQGLVYEIKDEKVDGDNAIVTAEIEVSDYRQIIKDVNNYLLEKPEEFLDQFGEYDITMFTDYKLSKLKDAKDKVKYTIEFNLKKEKKKWKIEEVSEEDYSKLKGMHE